MITFKCVVRALETMDVSWFVLENVDMDDWKDSNLDLILKALKSVGPGYFVQAYKIISTDYASPQRRIRLYFIGVQEKKYPTFNFTAVGKTLELFILKTQPPVSWISILLFGSILNEMGQ